MLDDDGQSALIENKTYSMKMNRNSILANNFQLNACHLSMSELPLWNSLSISAAELKSGLDKKLILKGCPMADG